MIKRGDRGSWANYSDRDAAFDPVSERSAGMMLGAFRSRWEDAGPTSFGHQFAGGDEAAFTRASASVSSGGPSAAAADFPAVFKLREIDGRNGFTIAGAEERDHSGYPVSSAGDINGDGFDDVIIGAYGAAPGDVNFAGASYVIFGKAKGFTTTLYLDDLDGTNGFRLEGINVDDRSGSSVSSAGDVNGDGFDDIIIGAGRADQEGRDYAGESYVVFGKAGGFTENLNLATLNGDNGFRIDGVRTGDRSGFSVSSAGDINGDGFDDIIIGAPTADPGGDVQAGASYVVFGKTDGFAASIDLSRLDGINGFRIDGAADEVSGASVSSAGDVNGDGFDDIIIGAPTFRLSGARSVGSSYVVFGKADGFAPSLDLSTLDGTNGFRLVGIDAQDYSGRSVSSAGDVNGDGFDDIIIGAGEADPGGDAEAGESYVVFGKAGGFAASVDLSSLDGSDGFRLEGISRDDYSGFSVSSAGDFNGDGFDDILIGAPFAGEGFGYSSAGQSYVVFGKAGGFAASLDLATLDGTNGFRLDGQTQDDNSGLTVSSAGDVNGDGFDDIIIGADDADPNPIGQYAGESYVIFGQAPTEAVTRIGSAADQTIRGGDFNDTLNGKGGDDTLAGGKGADSLTGGTGADDFLLASRRAADADTILDFGGADRIALDGGVFRLAEGDLAAKRFVVGDAAADASDRLIYDDATGQLFFDPDGTGAKAQVLIATLTDAPPLVVSDIVVI